MFDKIAKQPSFIWSMVPRNNVGDKIYSDSNFIAKDTNGLPLPPSELMQYGENTDQHLRSGERDGRLVIDCLLKTDQKKGAILDFGCSNGRVTRWLYELSASREVWGVDINAATVMWAALHLRPLNFCTMSTYGALPFCDSFFSFVFSYSVFTHMDEAFTYWLQELRRIVMPNGCVLLTLHDEEAIEYARKISNLIGEIDGPDFMFIKKDNAFGAYNKEFNQLNTFIRRDIFLRLVENSFEIMDIFPKTMGGFQTAYLMRRLPIR